MIRTTYRIQPAESKLLCMSSNLPFVETLRVTNPVRQSRASSREASLAWGRATVTAKHPDRELLGVGGDYLDHVERALQR